MRYVIGNWKMRLSGRRSERLAAVLARALRRPPPGVALAVCPSHTALEEVAEDLRGSRIALGAQDAFWAERGSFTGEVGMAELREYGVRYLIVGHSERRHVLGETDAVIGKKLAAALAAGIVPVLCVGETLAERRRGRTDAVVRRQLAAALAAVRGRRPARLLVAYEPVWAIGTGRVCDAREAARVHALLRAALRRKYGEAWVRAKARILYGGSVDRRNAPELAATPGIDGALVGGASLTAASFVAIVRAFGGGRARVARRRSS